MTKEEWYKKLVDHEAFCYIKPNRHKHESGYRCFEVGYLTLTEKWNKSRERLVLNQYSDQIVLFPVRGGRSFEPNLELLLDGYICIYEMGVDRNFWWGSMEDVLDSAELQLLPEFNI